MFTSAQRIISRTVLPFILFSPMFSYIMRVKNAAKPDEIPEKLPLNVSFVLGEYDEPCDLHTHLQNKFLPKIMQNDLSRIDGKSERSKPEPVELYWEIQSEEDIDFEEFTVKVSTENDMSSAKEYVTENDYIKIFNCYMDETYYWTVSAEYDDITYTSSVSSFSTLLDCPRSLFVEGVTNVRDMGGWNTLDGSKVRQGMIYRTGRLHTDDGVEITANGIDTMLNDMNIKTEIDLRNEIEITEFGPLGQNVNYFVLPMNYTDEILTAEAENIRKFFDILSKEENYPIIFHCYIGTDRTGACAFLIGALLGLSDNDLTTDYMFSNYGYIGGSRTTDAPERYLSFMQSYAGETLSDKTRSYLLSIGVTEKQIETILDIMIEPAD